MAFDARHIDAVEVVRAEVLRGASLAQDGVERDEDAVRDWL